MIDIGVLRTYKLYNGWSASKVRKIEGYGALSGTPFDELCHGMLISIDTRGELSYLLSLITLYLITTLQMKTLTCYTVVSLMMKEQKVDVGLWINKMRRMVLSIPHLRECFM